MLPLARSRATRTEVHGDAMISANASAVGGAGDDESWGSRRANAATRSGVAAEAMVTSIDAVVLLSFDPLIR